MESDLGSPGRPRKLMIWSSWPADCLAGWLAIPGEARIQPWRSFWCSCKGILLMESDLGSPGKTRTLMIWTSWPADCLASWLAGWRSLVKPGFGPGEVFGVSVKEFC